VAAVQESERSLMRDSRVMSRLSSASRGSSAATPSPLARAASRRGQSGGGSRSQRRGRSSAASEVAAAQTDLKKLEKSLDQAARPTPSNGAWFDSRMHLRDPETATHSALDLGAPNKMSVVTGEGVTLYQGLKSKAGGSYPVGSRSPIGKISLRAA
jgi:hypothetical protein